nr:conjugal transfer protein TraM [Methylobacter sp. BBA5.1]
MILQTINERLMQDSAAAQQEILDRFKEEMEAIAHRWGDDAKNKAERTLNAALTASREAMMTTMHDCAIAAPESLRCEVESTTTRLASSIRESRRVATMNLIAASMTIFAAGLVLWVLG